MSELIDVACDICGRRYRWPDERLGDSATCRDCNTQFEVTEYVPPEEDTVAADLRWFKGVGEVLLVLAVVIGLSSLLVIHPANYRRNIAQSSSSFGPVNSHPAGSASPHLPLHSSPPHDLLRSHFEARPQPHGQTPGEAPVSSLLSPANQTLPPVNLSQLPTRFTKIPPNTTPEHQASSPPVVTEWGFVSDSHTRRLQLKGQGLQGLTRFQYRFGSGLTDTACQQVSDSLVETDGFFVRSSKVTLYVISNPLGTAVVFSDDIPTIDTPTTLNRVRVRDEPDLFLVRHGGELTSNRPIGVLVDTEGRATVTPWVNMAIVKPGGYLKTQSPSSTILETGASVVWEKPGVNERSAPDSRPAIQFYRLPVIH